MTKIKSISRVVAVAGAIAIAAQFAMVPAAFAKGGKSPKCYAQPVAGSPGTYVWTCTTGRP